MTREQAWDRGAQIMEAYNQFAPPQSVDLSEATDEQLECWMALFEANINEWRYVERCQVTSWQTAQFVPQFNGAPVLGVRPRENRLQPD